MYKQSELHNRLYMLIRQLLVVVVKGRDGMYRRQLLRQFDSLLRGHLWRPRGLHGQRIPADRRSGSHDIWNSVGRDDIHTSFRWNRGLHMRRCWPGAMQCGTHLFRGNVWHVHEQRDYDVLGTGRAMYCQQPVRFQHMYWRPLRSGRFERHLLQRHGVRKQHAVHERLL